MGKRFALFGLSGAEFSNMVWVAWTTDRRRQSLDGRVQEKLRGESARTGCQAGEMRSGCKQPNTAVVSVGSLTLFWECNRTVNKGM